MLIHLLFASESAVTPAIAVVAVFGIAALWAASRLRIPSILLLLPAGIVAGPVLGWVDPDEQFGALLFPLISLGVGILLFEGASICGGNAPKPSAAWCSDSSPSVHS